MKRSDRHVTELQQLPESAQDRIRKRSAIKGPRDGDWVTMPDAEILRLTSNGIRKMSSWVISRDRWPIDAVQDPKDPNRVDHPCFSTDHFGDGNFYLLEDGRISYSGGNKFHDVSRRAQLIDTGETKPGRFRVFQMNDPELNPGMQFDLECWVYRLSEAAS